MAPVEVALYSAGFLALLAGILKMIELKLRKYETLTKRRKTRRTFR